MFTEQTSEHGEIASEKAVIGTKVPRWDGAGLVARWWPFRIDPGPRSKRILLDSFGELGTEEQWSGD